MDVNIDINIEVAEMKKGLYENLTRRRCVVTGKSIQKIYFHE